MDNVDLLLVPPLARDARSQALAQLAARLSDLDLSPLLVYLVDAVPPSALPLLGEQFHVMGYEGWDLAESAPARRRLIKRAIELHRYKGTPWAIKQALATLGFTGVALQERLPGTHWAEFEVEVDVTNRPVSAVTYTQIEQVINAYKPVRCHLRRLTLRLTTPCTAHVGAATLSGETITLYPHQLTQLDAFPPRLYSGIGLHSWETIAVYPH